MSDYPYTDRFEVNRTLPEVGRSTEDILAELSTMANEEDHAWEGGHVSGSIYCGDHDHYAFLTEAFGKFAHVNALQRDLCPSATKFEGEIIAMVLDILNADAVPTSSCPKPHTPRFTKPRTFSVSKPEWCRSTPNQPRSYPR